MTATEKVSAMVDRLAALPATTIDGSLHRLKGFVADVNSTNLTIVSGLAVGILTEVVYLTTMVAEKPPEPVTFGMWLGFVASWIGFGVRQFRVKRETHVEGGVQGSGRASGVHSAPGAGA